MQHFKISFPSGYDIGSVLNDNIDINIIFESGETYFATLFTLKNVEYLLSKDQEGFFWATNMIVIKDLRKITIKEAVNSLVNAPCFKEAVSFIGHKHNYEHIKDLDS